MTTFTTVEIDPDFDLTARFRDNGLLWTRRNEGFAAWGEAIRIPVGSGPDRFALAASGLVEASRGIQVEDPIRAPGTGPVAFGSFTYDDSAAAPVLVVPEVVVGRRDGRAWITYVGKRPVVEDSELLPAGRIRYAGATEPETGWLEKVTEATRAIERGELTKVVMARDLIVWSEHLLAPGPLARRLAARFADCFTFFIDGLIGASPELLVRRSGKDVESLPLAGSARRGADVEDDELVAKQLLASAKDNLEHRLAVDSVVEALSSLADGVTLDPDPRIFRLANIQHLATRVRGRLRRPLTALEIAGALHPTAAVCGTPTTAAKRFIGTHESMSRGRYAGPVGWVDLRGDGEWAIALRCAELNGNRARLFAGSGIVAGSLPEIELEETRLKLNAMLNALEAP